MTNTQTIGNNYGAGLTAQDVVNRHGQDRGFKDALKSSAPNFAMRLFLASFGFNRVTRSFADAVIAAA